METFKAIRKIFLTLSAIIGIGIFIILYYWDRLHFLESIWFPIAQFIGFILLFKSISMIIEARNKDQKNQREFEEE